MQYGLHRMTQERTLQYAPREIICYDCTKISDGYPSVVLSLNLYVEKSLVLKIEKYSNRTVHLSDLIAVKHVMRRTRLQPRTLPLLLAANPVNWGKPGKLTTVEALAAALYLMGQNRQATELLSKFRWGEQFMNLNKEPLRAYTEAKSSAELVSLQFEFFDIEVEDDAQ